MTPREETQLIYDRVLVDGLSVVDAINEAYEAGREARGPVPGTPEVFRIVNASGYLIPRAYGSKMKRLYPNPGDAKRALQWAPEGARVQAGRVEWEDL